MMINEKKISVLMSIYNEPLIYIQKALDSIKSQTYQNIEIIVIVDKPDYQNAITYLNSEQRKDSRINYYVNDVNIVLQ